MTKNSTALILGLCVAAALPAHSGGYRRSSYGGRGRAALQLAHTGAAPAAAPGYNSGGAAAPAAPAATAGPITSYSGGRGAAGYGQMRLSNYSGGTGGYARGFGARALRTRYSEAPGAPEAPPAGQAPVQGFAVPGALIRTAGLGHKVGEPSQPAREFAVAAGRIAVQDHLARSESGGGLRVIPGDRYAGANAGGSGGTRPNAPIAGLNGAMFGGDKTHDPSSFNPNRAGGRD